MSDTKQIDPYRWKPGESGNPKGRPPGDPIMREVAALTKEELRDMASLMIKGKMAEIKEISDKPDNYSPLEVMTARCVLKICSRGDTAAFDQLLNRIIGKVKDEVQHSGAMPFVTIEIPSNGREIRDERLERTDIDKATSGTTD